MLIADMFTGELSAPRDTVDLTVGFYDFWKAWPSSTRKVARSQCLAKWCKMALWEQERHICAHVAFMKAHPDWQKDNGAFICSPLVYLNQERWADWELVEVKAAPKVDPALQKILDDEKKAAPMPSHVLALKAKLRAQT